MRVIGITGRSGCGKSAVTEHYRALGYPAVDADALSRAILEPGSPCLPQLQAAFGTDVVQDGVLNRRLVADRAFATPEGTETLTKITHPEIIRRVRAARDAARAQGAPLFFVDGAVIIGSAFESECDVIALVTAPRPVSIQRICARDGLTPEQAARRLDAQTPEEELARKAQAVLRNDSDLTALYAQADAWLNRWKEGAGTGND